MSFTPTYKITLKINYINMGYNKLNGMYCAKSLESRIHNGRKEEKGMKVKPLHEQGMEQKGKETKSPLDLIKIHGGHAHKVGGMAVRGADSMIAVYKNRVTYTFIMNKEVASIHYDRDKGEIFFSGHNIRNVKLTAEQKGELFELAKVLDEDPEGKVLRQDYYATLTDLIADNK